MLIDLLIDSLRHDVVQSYITWTKASEPLQFFIDDNEGRRQANVQFNISQPLPSYDESYSVILLDRYLQPQVSSTYVVYGILHSFVRFD